MNDSFITLLILQVIAHVGCDFFLQSNDSCADKSNKGFQSKILYVHALIAGVLSFISAFDWTFWPISVCIGVMHLLIDGWKSTRKPFPTLFFIDQGFHLIIIAIGCLIYWQYYTWGSWITQRVDVAHLYLILALLLCLKPANIIIQEVMKGQGLIATDTQYDELQKVTQELKNAGRLIGNLERLLTLGFVITGHFAAIGFIIAAKSILRYRDGDTAKTEYVLVGTFLSIGCALALGMVYNYLYG